MFSKAVFEGVICGGAYGYEGKFVVKSIGLAW